MKLLIVILLALLLSGCSTLASLLDTAAEANDKALVSAEFTICKAASIGSVMRRYNSEAKAKAWAELCNQNDQPASHN